MSAAPVLLALRNSQVCVAGRKTPIVSVPSPFQSPTTGTSPATPNWKVSSGGPGELELRNSQVSGGGGGSGSVGSGSGSGSTAGAPIVNCCGDAWQLLRSRASRSRLKASAQPITKNV